MAIDLSRVKSKIDSFEKKTREKKDYSKVLFKPEEGKSYNIRLVPSKFDESWPFTDIAFHYNLGVPYTLVALDESVDPIIIAANKLRKSNDPAERDLAYSLTPKVKTFVPIIVRGEEDKGVRLFSFGKELFTSLLKYIEDVEENGDIIDVKSGSDFSLTTTKEKMGKGSLTYLKPTLTIKRNSSPLSTDPAQITEWLTNQPDPDELYEKKTPEELKAILFAKVEADTAAANGDADEEEVAEEDPLTEIFKQPAPVAAAPSKPAAAPAKVAKGAKGTDKFASLFEE